MNWLLQLKKIIARNIFMRFGEYHVWLSLFFLIYFMNNRIIAKKLGSVNEYISYIVSAIRCGANFLDNPKQTQIFLR